MGQMIKRGNELIRINPEEKTRIEFSDNNGMSWYARSIDPSCGDFLDLIDDGKVILAQTSKGLYFSDNNGMSWYFRG